MTLTVDLLRQWFLQFNSAYFGGALPVPAFGLSRARTRLGSMTCRCERTLFHRRCYDFTIRVSTFYDSTERDYQTVLLHEMIHYCIAYKGIRDTSAHGSEFLRMMHQLNSVHGWNISVSSPRRGKIPDTSRKCADVYAVLAITMHTGERYLSVVNPCYARTIDCQAQSVSQIAQHRWYMAHDPFFRTFPKVRTLRARRVTKEVYEEKTRSMEPMEVKSFTALRVGKVR